MFLWFFRSFGRNFRCKWVIKFLRRLKEAHLRFPDFKNLKILKKRVRVKFNDVWEYHNWKPLFALISVRILLKQLDYSLSISMR